MERKLLLLGLLQNHEMYGYQLNEVMDAHLGSSIQLKKPTMYKLLNQMAEDGWLTFHEEKAGNRPTRRVYAITAEGKAAFKRLLRQSLPEYKPADFMGHISIAFLDVLPPDEVLDLLQQRRAHIIDLLQVARSDERHPGSMQLMIDHMIRHLSAELEWLDEVMQRVQEKEPQNEGDTQ